MRGKKRQILNDFFVNFFNNPVTLEPRGLCVLNTPLTLSGCRRLINGQLTDGKTHISTELEQDLISVPDQSYVSWPLAVGKDGKRDGEEGVWGESISRGQRNRS